MAGPGSRAADEGQRPTLFLIGDSTVKSGSLVLVVGADYDGLREGITAEAPTTTTSTPEPSPLPKDAVPKESC